MEFIDLKTQYRQLQEPIRQRINAVLEHGKFIMGPEIDELENRLASYVGTKHCISMSSGTDALLIAMMALDIKPGDEVITTPFSFIATAETIALLGAIPVFVDINPHTYNLDPDLLEAAINRKTKAIIPVSLYGQCADFDAINAIAGRHNLPVIEDAAQSFGATYKKRYSCALTTIGCTSFFPSKPLGAYGDGGACFTNDDALARKMRDIRIHGQDRRYHHYIVGVNGRMDTLQAAILLAKLDTFPQEVESRARIGARYTELFSSHTGLINPPVIEKHNTSVYAQYTIQVNNREAVIKKLNDAGVPTAVHYPIPLHRQPAICGTGRNYGNFPVAEKASDRVMSLPMHPFLDEKTQDFIVASVIKAVSRVE